jgi:putative transcription antitermination factor YqgF
MSTYLCIDPGLSHTGVAISSSVNLAEPLTTIHTKDPDKTLERVLSIINERGPDQVIIGQPLFGPIRSLSQDLFNALKLQFSGPIHLFPEDLSSKIASQKLIQSGNKKQNRDDKKHAAAAAVILQDFLESPSI